METLRTRSEKRALSVTSGVQDTYLMADSSCNDGLGVTLLIPVVIMLLQHEKVPIARVIKKS